MCKASDEDSSETGLGDGRLKFGMFQDLGVSSGPAAFKIETFGDPQVLFRTVQG